MGRWSHRGEHRDLGGQVLGPIAFPIFVAGFAFVIFRPRAASAGGVLTAAGLWILWGELRLVQSCNAVNANPQGRCTHEDVTLRILIVVGVIVLGTVLTTYAFARARHQPLGR